MAATHVQSLVTDLCADAVAWSGELLACATYQLDEKTNKRRGGVLLYRLHKNEGEKQPALHLQSCVIQPDNLIEDDVGVLDIKWIHGDDETTPTLLTARANGCVELLKFTETSDHAYSLSAVSCPVGDTTGTSPRPPICLSVDHVHANDVITSDDRGLVTVCKIGDGRMGVVRQWKGHAHEAWIAIFGSQQDTVLSGGDDCRLCVWDTRCDPCVGVASKRHDMGVVSIQNHPSNPNLFASGSYNEVLSLWDIRTLKRPIQELSLGGGVWRIRWCHAHPDLVALACMHGGFKIADLNKNEIMSSYNGHSSLAYGIDWYRAERVVGDSGLVLASCSFYDHSLHLWTFKQK